MKKLSHFMGDVKDLCEKHGKSFTHLQQILNPSKGEKPDDFAPDPDEQSPLGGHGTPVPAAGSNWQQEGWSNGTGGVGGGWGDGDVEDGDGLLGPNGVGGYGGMGGRFYARQETVTKTSDQQTFIDKLAKQLKTFSEESK